MRNYVIPLIILALLAGACLFESLHLDREIERCETSLDRVLADTETDEAEALRALEDFETLWEKEKKVLHTYIPHTEIHDLDVWISEAKSYLAHGEKHLAHARLSGIRDKLAGIPDAYDFSFDNIF